VLTAAVALALAAPLLAVHDPHEIVSTGTAAPRATLPLGANALGQDLFSQVLYGARTSLLAGIAAAVLATTLSAVFGIAAAAPWKGRGLALGIIDLTMALPAVPLVVLLVVFWGPGFWPLATTLALLGWAPFARVVRTRAGGTLRAPYVEAARALGATEVRIVHRIVVPDAIPILFVKFLLTVRWAIVMEATLGLLGLADPGRISWGLMLHQAFSYPLLFVTDAWIWWAGPPALGIVAITLGLLAIGQAVDRWAVPVARASRRETHRAPEAQIRWEPDARQLSSTVS
jgi:ABC-type dipeptide/oligopeptide/nickel transport system permease subunit